MRTLIGAWKLVGADPVGVLLPAAVACLLQVIAIVATREIWAHVDAWTLLGWIAASQLVRVVLTIPLRSAILAAGARVAGYDVRGWRRTPSLTPVAVLAFGAELALVTPVAAVGLALGSTLATRGSLGAGLGLLAVLVLVCVALSLVVRSVFAYAVVEAVAGRSAPWRALRDGVPQALRDLPAVLLLTAAGDLAIASGALTCGAGVLPGYPIGDLAVLHRWSTRRKSG